MTTTTPRELDRGTEHARRSRNATLGAFLGFFVDMFDIYLPIVALAPAIGYFVAGTLSSSDRSLVTSLIFVATLVGRPIGAFVFGYYADRIGRKRATITALSGCGVLTIIIAVLPGYQQWGSLSLVLFIALRFVVGIFVGGEYTAASPLGAWVSNHGLSVCRAGDGRGCWENCVHGIGDGPGAAVCD